MLPDERIKARPVEATIGRFLALAIPIMLAHVTEPLLGLVDTASIGRLNDVPLLGAVAIGALFFDFIFWGLGSLRPSTAGLTAQAVGAGSDYIVRLTVHRALFVATLLGLVMVLVRGPLIDLALYLLSPGQAVQNAARTYIGIRIWSAPFALANYAILGSLIGRGRTDLGLWLQVSINAVKVVLAILLVAVAGYGIAGAAIGTILAEAIGTALGLAALLRLGVFSGPVRLQDLTNPKALKRLLCVNVDIMIRTLALLTAFGFFTSESGRMGDITLAANQVLNLLFLFAVYFLDGFATAGEQLCGQALGARDETGFRRSVSLVLRFSVLTGLALTGLIFMLGTQLIGLIATHPGIRAYAEDYLIYAALTPLAGALAFAFDGIYIGATWTKAMRNLMVLALTIYFVAFAMLSDWGNAGLWIAILIFLFVRGIGQWIAYPTLVRRAFTA